MLNPSEEGGGLDEDRSSIQPYPSNLDSCQCDELLKQLLWFGLSCHWARPQEVYTSNDDNKVVLLVVVPNCDCMGKINKEIVIHIV